MMESEASALIFRTSWVYGPAGNNFLKTMLRLARERDELRVVADQHGAPTCSEDLARLVVHVIRKLEAEAIQKGVPVAKIVDGVRGVYHACGKGETTWSGFAAEIVRLAQIAEPDQKLARIVPILSSAYPTAARRPMNSRLNCQKLERTFGFVMPPWEESVGRVMKTLGGHHPNQE